MKHFYFKLNILVTLCLLSFQTKSQTGERWYYNIDAQNIAIGGYDVVAYHNQNKAMVGDENISSLHEGVHYRFSSKANQKHFEADPEKYLPAYGGWCTFFMGIDQEATAFAPTRMQSDPTNFKVIEGQLYLFRKTARQNFLESFESGDTKAILARADAFWQSRVDYGIMANGLPEGLNPMARMENIDWLPFMGKWEAQAYWWADTTGAVKNSFKGEWEFRYGYDGYCVQDDFKSIPDLPFAGTQNGPAIRGYDVQNHEWHMTYIPVNAPRSQTWLMTGKFLGHGNLEGRLESQDPLGNPILQKVIFRLIDKDHMEWQAQWSWDEGKTWKEKTGFLTAIKVK